MRYGTEGQLAAIGDPATAELRRVLCAVSGIAGPEHFITGGRGVVVPWDVMGDPRDVAEVCADCAENVETEPCDVCGIPATHFPVVYGDPGYCCSCFDCDGHDRGGL